MGICLVTSKTIIHFFSTFLRLKILSSEILKTLFLIKTRLSNVCVGEGRTGDFISQPTSERYVWLAFSLISHESQVSEYMGYMHELPLLPQHRLTLLTKLN